MGVLAMLAAVLCFSISSTLIKKAEIPGIALAFWRMSTTTALWWLILWVSERELPSAQDLRRGALPGAVFGLNIMCFFSSVTRTSIAHAEFLGALTPLLVIPAGAMLFHERLRPRSLAFGLISLAGLALVLFNGPAGGDASVVGDLLSVCAMVLWTVYLLVSRQRRGTMSVQRFMASMMPFATMAVVPFVVARGEIGEVHGTQWWYVLALTLLTGTGAHGLIVFAQRSVPVGVMGTIQVAQPAIAVAWAYALLDQELVGIQVVGMALVLCGLLAVVVSSRRDVVVVESTPVVAVHE